MPIDRPIEGRERDLVLSPNEFVHILDETKGNINTYVGPNKASLGNTEKPVLFDEKSKRFQPCTLDVGIQQFKTAPEGWYVILKNPAAGDKRPQSGKAEVLIDLQVGRKVNMPGPISFPLWPGQMAKVIKGHHIRSNEYLVGRIYDDEAAKKNWASAVVKATDDAKTEAQGVKAAIGTHALTMGQQIIIKGTEVSFFIPPTGIEIIPDDEDNYVRRAVTLERLEYCILLDEDGNKSFIQGPNVVFPKPTEQFLKRKDEGGNITRKYRAVELNPQMGIYIKVIAPYEEAGVKYSAGDELFLTGNEVKIYYPRPEHAIMRYGTGSEIHYAVAIPAGEGRYLMDKPTGAINTVTGPNMLLADPRKQVIVNRMLSPKLCELMYPGNKEALQHNIALANTLGEDGVEKMLRESQYSSRLYSATLSPAQYANMMIAQAAPSGTIETNDPRAGARERKRSLVADDFSRKETFTPPRSITLNTRFQGAVQMTIWTGYAVQLTSRSGSRRVVVGPKSVLLDYDESPEVIKMSSGRPKGSKPIKENVFLRVHNNKVSDRVEAETADLVKVQMDLSYRVNFEGDDPSKWFEVEDYVKHLCDHARSMIRNAVKKIKVEEFNANPIDLVRDTILGTSADGKRTGRLFNENNMRVYDVEVLDVAIGDSAIAELLRKTQHNVVSVTLQLADAHRQLEAQTEMEKIAQKLEQEKAQTRMTKLQIAQVETQAQTKMEREKAQSQGELRTLELDLQAGRQEILDEINSSELNRTRAKWTQDIELATKNANLQTETLKAQSAARVAEAGAITPGLVEALQANANVALLHDAYKNMAPLAIVGNKTVAELVQDLVKGTKLEGLLKK